MKRDDTSEIKHDHIVWLKQFHQASNNGGGFSELRADIYTQTVSAVTSGSYRINGKQICFNNAELIANTEYFTQPPQLPNASNNFITKFTVIEADCIETGKLLKDAGYDVCVLNMANRQNPGGGVCNGAGAQEENIFRRTNIFESLYQFRGYAKQYGIIRHDKSYPLNRATGGVYSKDVTVFRSSETTGYSILSKPYSLSFVSVPAINKPDLEVINGEHRITQSLIEPTKEKIKTILRIAKKFNHDCLVLGAFGCGAFKNPPKHVAELFREVFHEQEFCNQFKQIVFSIIDDHNSWKRHNPAGNIIPFIAEFDD